LIKRMYINNQFDEQYVKTLEGITEMSKYSIYPLVCNDVERKNSQNKDSSYLWMRNGTIVRKETVHPMFSNRTYVIGNGRTIEIKEKK
ncbi:MAG: hypothetical protein LC101_00005, partial [Flavobacteriales bacterium]|nr:hypothetical protein [Flavobacteriales bacterium]